MAVLSESLFDDIEFDAASSGDHHAAARRMSRLAETGEQGRAMSRAEAHFRAGEQWLLADEADSAADCFRRALADGGLTFVDARVPLARALCLLGQTGAAADLIAEIKADGPGDPRVFDLIAEILLEQGDLAGALEWATAGVELCVGAGIPTGAVDDAVELRLLLNLRYRIRNDLGLPEDRYDRLLDEQAADARGGPDR